jgi:putative ABC transport system permease protein
VTILTRKLLRDLRRLKWQMAAIALLVACGVSVAVMAFSAQKALVTAQRNYYRQTAFGDLFATATRAPRALVAELARIDGVLLVDARAVKTGLMEVPGQMRPATARLIALPDDERRSLNRIVLVAGRLPDPARADEAVALATFLDAAHVALGERLTMVIDGHRLTFRIVGAALSPEYVYVPSFGPMPDDAHSGVFWAPRDAVERPAGLGDAFSAVSLALAPGASAAAALARIDRLLAPYGGAPAYARADQISHKFQQNRIDRLSVMAMVLPPVFLVVAAGLVHLVLGRMVDAERDQIGLLKAFGYDDLAAAAIYLKMAALVGLAGAIAGGAAGRWLAWGIVAELAQYMRFPHLRSQFSWTAFGVSVGISVAAAVAGSLLAGRRAARLSPAVAMQPPAPATFRRGAIERLRFVTALDQPTRMIARNLERYPLRAALTTAGLAASVALLVGSQFMFGSMDSVVDQAYYRARRWSDEVAFADARAVHAVAELSRMPAVLRAEPYRMVSARLHAHFRAERVVVVGLDEQASLERMLDPHDRPIPFTGDTIAVSQPLAGRLGIRAGEMVDLEVSEGRRPRIRIAVSAIDRDYAGLTIHMPRTLLNRLMGDGDVASGSDLLVAADRRAEFYRAIVRAPSVVGVGSRDDTVAMFRSSVAAVMTTEMTFFLGFAGAIAFGIAYNISRIALADRARDLATLRVLGFSPAECAYILCGELGGLALAAAPIGVLGGFGLARALVAAFTRQDFYLPFIISPSGLGTAFITYLCAVLAAAALVAQRIWRFDLVAVLKTRD